MDAHASVVPASSDARAIRAGRREQRRARIYWTKTVAEVKSSVLALSGEMDAEWRPAATCSRSELPEEGLEPTRTYAQALLRRPRLPFRHSGGDARRVYPSTLVGNLSGMFPSKRPNADRHLLGRSRPATHAPFPPLI